MTKTRLRNLWFRQLPADSKRWQRIEYANFCDGAQIIGYDITSGEAHRCYAARGSKDILRWWIYGIANTAWEPTHFIPCPNDPTDIPE